MYLHYQICNMCPVGKKVVKYKTTLYSSSHTEHQSRRWRRGSATMSDTEAWCRMTLPTVSIIKFITFGFMLQH